jgi:hypothetical protein
MNKTKEPNVKDLRAFGLVLAGILLVIGAAQFFKGHSSVYPWFLTASSVSLALSLAAPGALTPVFTVFVRVARAVGWVNARVLLILIYYLLIVPLSGIIKILGKDPLVKGFDRGVETYWIKKEDAGSADELEKQF